MKKNRKPQPGTPTESDLGQALADMQEWTKRAAIKSPPAQEALDDATVEIAERFARMLRCQETAGLMQELKPLLAILQRAKSLVSTEASELVKCITTVFSQAVMDARQVSTEATAHRKKLQGFADKELNEIMQTMQAARDEISTVVKDFSKRAEEMENARRAARSIKTVLAEMRDHASELRKMILKRIAAGEHEQAGESMKALFAFYDVNLQRRFDCPGEVIYGDNLVIDANDTVILNGRPLLKK